MENISNSLETFFLNEKNLQRTHIFFKKNFLWSHIPLDTFFSLEKNFPSSLRTLFSIEKKTLAHYSFSIEKMSSALWGHFFQKKKFLSSLTTLFSKENIPQLSENTFFYGKKFLISPRTLFSLEKNP